MTQEQNNQIEEIVDATINVNLMIAKFLIVNSKEFKTYSTDKQEAVLAEVNKENALKDKSTIDQLKELKMGLHYQLLSLE
jgi:hypothetical protein